MYVHDAISEKSEYLESAENERFWHNVKRCSMLDTYILTATGHYHTRSFYSMHM